MYTAFGKLRGCGLWGSARCLRHLWNFLFKVNSKTWHSSVLHNSTVQQVVLSQFPKAMLQFSSFWIFAIYQQWQLTVRIRVSADCGSYFYIPNTRKVYLTMDKIQRTAKLQHYRFPIVLNKAAYLILQSSQQFHILQFTVYQYLIGLANLHVLKQAFCRISSTQTHIMGK